MRLGKTTVAAAAVLAAGTLAWVLSHPSEPEPRASSGPRAISRPASSEPESPSPAAPIAALPPAGEVERVAPAPKPAHGPLPDTEDIDPKVQGAAIARTLDNVLSQQAPDRHWARTMEDGFQTFFRSEKAVGSSMRNVECRATLCRVDVRLESKEARELFTTNVGSMAPPGATAFVNIQGDDDLSPVVYWSRPDHALPL